jgi:hypothetical protein
MPRRWLQKKAPFWSVILASLNASSGRRRQALADCAVLDEAGETGVVPSE